MSKLLLDPLSRTAHERTEYGLGAAVIEWHKDEHKDDNEETQTQGSNIQDFEFKARNYRSRSSQSTQRSRNSENNEDDILSLDLLIKHIQPSKLSLLWTQLREVRVKITTLREKSMETTNQIYLLEQKVEDANEMIAIEKEKSKKAIEGIHLAEEQIHSLEEKNERTTHELNAAEEKDANEMIAIEKEKSKKAIEGIHLAEEQIHSLEEKNERTTHELNAAEEKIYSLEEKNERTAHELNAAEEKILSLEIQLTVARSEVETLKLSTTKPISMIQNAATIDAKMIEDMRKQLLEMKEETQRTKQLVDKETSSLEKFRAELKNNVDLIMKGLVEQERLKGIIRSKDEEKSKL